MDNYRLTIRDKIIQLIEQEYTVTIDTRTNQKIVSLLNQLHGYSFNQGLKEGSSITNKYNELRSELIAEKGMSKL